MKFKMDSNKMMKGRFTYKDFDITCYKLITLKGSFKENILTSLLAWTIRKITLISNWKSIINSGVKYNWNEDIFHKTQYEIKDLLVTIDDY